jgi:lipoprotein-anchoring transpeptidase ErfK/SrfK
VLRPIAPIGGGATVLSITATQVRDGRRWVQVLLPMRPNGTRGWVPADVLLLSAISTRIVIDTGDRRLSLYRRGRRVMRVPVAVGKPGTPTPHGRWFAIAERIETNTPGAFLGPLVFPITGFSEKLNEFAGGDGRVAIHGTSLPQLIGTRASNGCIRMYNADVTRMATIIRRGTPVEIRP